MKSVVALLLLLLLLASPAFAQELPPTGGQSGQFLTIEYTVGKRFHLPTADETAQTVVFAPGEFIQSVEISDPSAYVIGISGSGESMTVMPKGSSTLTMLNVRTDRHNYGFDLVPTREQEAPDVVRFSYAAAGLGTPRQLVANTGQRDMAGTTPEWVAYRQSGDASVRPSSITDDGTRTYISFGEDQAIPAVFAIGPSGKEEMVDGYMRGGIYTIDRVYAQLVFRIDQDTAKAKRVIKRDRK